MIIGIGCDLVDHNVTKKLGWTTNMSEISRMLSQKEIEIYESHPKIEFIAGRFAVKEAVLKCLGTGMFDGISLTDIQVLQSDLGKPVLEVSGVVKKMSDRLRINYWHISITHSKSYSTAFVVAERRTRSSKK